MKHSFDWTIEREDAEGNSLSFEVEVEGTYRFGTPDSWTDPGDPAEFEIETITYLGEPFQTTPEEDELICDYVFDNPPDDSYDDY